MWNPFQETLPKCALEEGGYLTEADKGLDMPLVGAVGGELSLVVDIPTPTEKPADIIAEEKVEEKEKEKEVKKEETKSSSKSKKKKKKGKKESKKEDKEAKKLATLEVAMTTPDVAMVTTDVSLATGTDVVLEQTESADSSTNVTPTESPRDEKER